MGRKRIYPDNLAKQRAYRSRVQKKLHAKKIRAEQIEANRIAKLQKLVQISNGNLELDTRKRYPVIYADPPWHYVNDPNLRGQRGPQNHYPTMTVAEICALPVRDITTRDAALFIWSPNAMVADCMKVIEAWGFTYCSQMVWVKNKIGLGVYFRTQHETLMIAKRGRIPAPPPKNRPPSVLLAPRRKHSQKPIEVYEIIERMYPELPKIELFARNRLAGWDVWGNQC
jgi:N6-adenosine-specific RNA methylase IME4